MGLRGAGVGIDLGMQSIKVVDLRITDGGAVIRRALHFDRGALQQRGIDPVDRPRLAAFLKSEMDSARIPTREVALAISGKDSIIRYAHVPPVPSWRLKIIMDYEVGEVAEKIGEKLTSDYRVLPVTRQNDDDQTVIIGLAKESSLEGILGDLQKAGIMVARAVPAPVALFTAWSVFGQKPDLESPDDELVVVADLGAENLNMAFLLNGNLAFARSASFGGKNFTEALARDLEMDLAMAETTKTHHGSLDPNSSGRREETVNTLRGVAAQLLSTIQSSFKFSRSQTGVRLPEPARYILQGGGMFLPGLVSYLQAGLQKPVEVFQPAAAPAVDVGADAGRILAAAPGNFAVALGLAASGLRKDALSLSLLPSKYVERRVFRERTVYLYATMVFLVLFLGVQLFQGFSVNASARSRLGDLNGWKKTFDRLHSEMQVNISRNGKTRARINRILREAEVTPFQAFALDFLGKRAGPELKILAVKLITDAADDGEPVYLLQVDGSADNGTQKALEHIEELRAAFAAEARISKVEVPSTAPDGNWYRFQMLLTPSYPVYR